MNQSTPPQRSAVDKAALLFTVICAMGGMLWVKGPAVNSAQLLFRIVVSVVGLVGLITVIILKQRRSD